MRASRAATSLFVRQTSGLVKEFSTTDTFIFNTLGYALGMVLAITPTFLGGLYPNANIYVVLTLGTVLTVFNGLVYGLFSAAMPRSGGDYVFIGRTLGPTLGFVANWGFTWSQFLGLGVYTAWCVRDALSPALITLGYAAGWTAFVEGGVTVAKPVPMFFIGTLLLATVLIVSLAGMKLLKRFLNSLFVLAMLGTGVMMFAFLVASRADFVSAFNAFMGTHANLPNAYEALIQQAQSNGLQTSQPTDFISALLALPIGYWAFIGFTYSAYVGGEVKEPQKSQTIGILGSLVVGYVVYMITMGAYYNVVGRDFNNAVAAVQGLKSNPLPTSGSMSFFAGLLTRNLIAHVLISLSTFLWFYLLLFVMATICVRNIFAWSFDQIGPEALSRVTARHGAPWVATLVIVIIAELFMALQAFVGIAFMNYIAIFSVCFLIAGIAAIAFPYSRKELFEQAPPIVHHCLLGMPLITVAGVGNTILFLLVLYSALTNPGVSGVQGDLPIWVLIGIYGTGFAVYEIAKRYRAGQGIDLALLYQEIPPE
jgi:APA family basic amino acid/polyamine antiporter